MDAFSYLSVLLSIILGLAITQVLQGYRTLILSRRRIAFYAPPLIWSVLILAMVTQHWWASFGLAERQDWSFAVFATVLVQTILVYMMAAIVLPDIPSDQPIDLKDHYYREAPAFFAIAIAVIIWSLFRKYMLNGELPGGTELLFHAIFFTSALIAMLTRLRWIHETLPALIAAVFALYITLLFARLD